MITSHRDRRAFQNYDYNSRSAPFFYLKSQIMGGIMYAAVRCVRIDSEPMAVGVTALL